MNDTVRSTCYLSPSERIGIYTFTTMTSVLLNFGRAILFYFICLRASYILHNHMFSSVLRTFVQFFDNNPAGIIISIIVVLQPNVPSFHTGRILNRFSKDIGFLDDLLPYIFCEYLLVTSHPPEWLFKLNNLSKFSIAPAALHCSNNNRNIIQPLGCNTRRCSGHVFPGYPMVLPKNIKRGQALGGNWWGPLNTIKFASRSNP